MPRDRRRPLHAKIPQHSRPAVERGKVIGSVICPGSGMKVRRLSDLGLGETVQRQCLSCMKKWDVTTVESGRDIPVLALKWTERR